MSMREECWGSQKRVSPETGIRIGCWNSYAGPLEEQAVSYLNPCAISPAHGRFMLCIFCPCMYYCMYWSCVTCRSAEFSDLQMVTFSLCTVRKSLGILRSFSEMHNGLIGPGYFHILLSLPCDCCTWYMLSSYLGRLHFIKSVRLRWHWSFQNLWPDVLVVFCQLLSVVSALFQLVCFQNSHLMACISLLRFPICLPI